MRNDRMWRALRKRACDVVRPDLYRYGIRFCGSIQITDFNEPELGAIRIRRNRKLLDHLEIAKSARFRTEPAAVSDIGRQDFALELFSLAIVKQDLHLSRRFQCRHNLFLQRTARFDRCLQREPVVGVRTERDDVTRFPDRPKSIATKKFHWHAACESRQV